MLILLDIDGVMVPACSWKKPELLNDGFPEFSVKATSGLQKIISETGARILLSTSHKSSYTNDQWIKIFNLRGIAIDQIDKLPANENNLSRKEEILNWITSNNQNEDFVIIDDDKSLNDLPQVWKNKLVLTSSLVGLTPELANEVVTKL